MQLSTITKVAISFAFGAIVGGGVISSISSLSDTSSQLATDSVRSGIKISQSSYPPMPPCNQSQFTPEQQAQGMHCPTEAEYQQMMQQQQNQQQNQQQPPPSGQYPDPNQTQNQQTQPNTGSNYQPPAGQTGQNPPPGSNQPPPNGQYPNQGQNQFGQPGQPGQPPNAASTDIGRPPKLSFDQPAGLGPKGPNECLLKVGGQGLVDAFQSRNITPADMAKVGTCFSTSFNAAPGQGQPGQGGQPFGRMTIFPESIMNAVSSSSYTSPVNKCVAEIAGPTIAKEMFIQGIQPDNATRDKIFKAGCFGPPPGGQGGPDGQPGVSERQFTEPPEAVRGCLKNISGSDAVRLGKRGPSSEEINAARKCFDDTGTAMPVYFDPRALQQESTMMRCSEAVIGSEISTITPDKLSKELKDKIRKCFTSGDLAGIPTQPSLPEKVAKCMNELFGDTVFAQISAGKHKPTAEERKAGAACIPKKDGVSKIVGIAVAAVQPTQVEALLAAEVDTDVVSNPTITLPTSEEVDQNSSTAKITFAGIVDDGDTAEIYINSEASIVTAETKTTDSGKSWSTEVAFDSLSQGEEHTAYALIAKADGTLVRSEMVSFEAKAAESATATASSGTSRNMLISYGVLGALVVAIISLVVIRRKYKVTA